MKHESVIIAAILLLAACGVPARPDLSLERVQQAGVLRVALDASFPPLESVAPDGRIQGIDPHVASAVAGQLGVRAQFLNISSDGLKAAVLAGQADAIVSSFTPVREWSHELGYSRSYYDAGPVLSAASGDARQGLIGVEAGGDGEAPARRRWPDRIRLYATSQDAVEALNHGAITGVVLDVPDISLFAADAPGLHAIGRPLESVPYVVAVRKADRLLLQAIDAALADMKASGELEIGR
ncbi:MAG: amino acid ABC transporter substrate-binding protein [Chloroflexota bacterium]|nr:amino acid ABC transporter substrate-binding protein [Chloroflexota bacterium]